MRRAYERNGTNSIGESEIVVMKKMALIIAALVAITVIQATVLNDQMDKSTLGKILFSDPILSKDKTISCASCHKPEFAFADTSAVSVGVGGLKGTRNTPSAMNVRLQRTFFWDGRAKNLEEQALAPIENPVEMNLPVDEAVNRLGQNERYRSYFKKVFNEEPSRESLAQAIAAFERTLETSDSPFDEWKFYDRQDAVKEEISAALCAGSEYSYGFRLSWIRSRNLGKSNIDDTTFENC